MHQKEYRLFASAIMALHRLDQDMRRLSVEASADPDITHEFWPSGLDEFTSRILGGIIETIGSWPTIDKVGAKAASAAALLALHADHDVDFQKQCLGRMQAHEFAGRVSSIDLAYLLDRVLINRQNPQHYGTQLVEIKDKNLKRGYSLHPRKMEGSIRQVNRRRKKIGLGTVAQGIQDAYKKYGIRT